MEYFEGEQCVGQENATLVSVHEGFLNSILKSLDLKAFQQESDAIRSAREIERRTGGRKASDDECL